MDYPHEKQALPYLAVFMVWLWAWAVNNNREKRKRSDQVIFDDFLHAIKDYRLFGTPIATDKMYELKCLPPVKLTKLLFVAIKHKCHPDVGSELIAMGASEDAKSNTGYTALMYASLYDRTETATMLLAAGADPNAKNNKGSTALMLASMEGHTETAQALLAAGADKDAENINGRTALILASIKGHTKIVRMLQKTCNKSKRMRSKSPARRATTAGPR